MSSFPSTAYWRDYLFSIAYSCLLCHRSIDHRCLGLFLGFLSCSIDLYFYFCAITVLFWWLWLCSIVWSQGACFLQLCFSFSRLLCLFRLFCVSIQSYFLLLLFYFNEKYHWKSDRDCIESIDCLGCYNHFDDTDSSNPRTWYIFLFVSYSVSFISTF